MKKIYVLDTNVPLLDPDCLDRFEDNIIVIPSVLISELDNKKTRNDDIGRNARMFIRKLEELSKDQDLHHGVSTQHDGIVCLGVPNVICLGKIKEAFINLGNDDYILSVACSISDIMNGHTADAHQPFPMALTNLDANTPVILVSRDYNLRIKSKLFNIKAENYHSDRAVETNEFYEGWRILPVDDNVYQTYYSQQSMDKSESFTFHPTNCESWDLKSHEFKPFEYVILVAESVWGNTLEEKRELFNTVEGVALLKYDPTKERLIKVPSYREKLNRYHIYPKNLQQKMLVDLLFDKRITQKSIVGTSGTGKTLFSLLISLIMKEQGDYEEIIITRPPVAMEYDMGFLPGSETEKMEPYLRGFRGNLEFITGRLLKDEKMKDHYSLDHYGIKPESMTFMRGETIYKKIVIIDECQNATLKAMKTALTRIGEDSIVILLGDVKQIDYHLLDATNNGLTYAVELMKDEDCAGHVTLTSGERSKYSDLIAKKWNKTQV